MCVWSSIWQRCTFLCSCLRLGCKGWVSFDRAPPAWQCTAGLSTPPDKSLLTGAAQPHRGVPSQIPGKGKVAHDMKTHPVQGQPHKSSPTWYGVPSAQHVKNSMGAPGKSTGPLGCATVSPAGALPWLPWAHQTPLVPPCLLQASQLNVKPPTPCCAPCSCNETLHVGQVTAWQPEQVRQWDGGGCIARCEACHDRSKSTPQTRRHATGSPSNMGPRRRAHMEKAGCEPCHPSSPQNQGPDGPRGPPGHP